MIAPEWRAIEVLPGCRNPHHIRNNLRLLKCPRMDHSAPLHGDRGARGAGRREFYCACTAGSSGTTTRPTDRAAEPWNETLDGSNRSAPQPACVGTPPQLARREAEGEGRYRGGAGGQGRRRTWLRSGGRPESPVRRATAVAGEAAAD
jgi:hypothetical protein